MQDPTREEMLDYLRNQPIEINEFEIEEAVYWFANYYHGGQGSNLYSALSTSPYTPGPLATGPELLNFLYDELVAEFGECEL